MLVLSGSLDNLPTWQDHAQRNELITEHAILPREKTPSPSQREPSHAHRGLLTDGRVPRTIGSNDHVVNHLASSGTGLHNHGVEVFRNRDVVHLGKVDVQRAIDHRLARIAVPTPTRGDSNAESVRTFQHAHNIVLRTWQNDRLRVGVPHLTRHAAEALIFPLPRKHHLQTRINVI